MLIKEVFLLSQNPTEIEIFLSHLLGKDRSFIKAFPETVLTKVQITKTEDFISRRKNHEPLAYILGFQDFYGLRFAVNKNVLIPRPETESLVEAVLAHAKTMTSLTRRLPVIAEVGTGSGCIAIALAKNLPRARIFALEVDKKALKVARENIKNHKVSKKVELREGNLLESFTEKVGIVVANLPYIPSSRIPALEPEVQWEPKIALDGGSDGMELYKKLFSQAKQVLKSDGVLFYEAEDGAIFKKEFNKLQEDGRAVYPERYS